METAFYKNPPSNFSTSPLLAAGVFVEWEEKILYLKRASHKLQGNKWGVPGGKLEPGETPKEAAIRELLEEAGVSAPEEKVSEIGPLYCRFKGTDYVFFSFFYKAKEKPALKIEAEESSEAGFFSLSELRDLPLIAGGFEALSLFLEKSTT